MAAATWVRPDLILRAGDTGDSLRPHGLPLPPLCNGRHPVMIVARRDEMIDPLCWRLPGVDLHGKVRGSDPSTILVQGSGGCILDWDALWAQLNPALAAIRYDLRGFGQSSAHNAGTFSHSDDL